MSEQVGYGGFPGGDPRKFFPDPECSTEAEREAHRRACAIWDAGAQLGPMDPAHQIVTDDTGRLLMHIARSSFGLGTYVYDDGQPECGRCGDSGVVDTGRPSDADAGATVFVACPDCGGGR